MSSRIDALTAWIAFHPTKSADADFSGDRIVTGYCRVGLGTQFGDLVELEASTVSGSSHIEGSDYAYAAGLQCLKQYLDECLRCHHHEAVHVAIVSDNLSFVAAFNNPDDSSLLCHRKELNLWSAKAFHVTNETKEGLLDPARADLEALAEVLL